MPEAADTRPAAVSTLSPTAVVARHSTSWSQLRRVLSKVPGSPSVAPIESLLAELRVARRGGQAAGLRHREEALLRSFHEDPVSERPDVAAALRNIARVLDTHPLPASEVAP